MPFGKWKDFDDCVRDFISRGKDEESARRICGYLQARLGRESHSWFGDIEASGRNLIKGEAIHPIKTYHPEEWPKVRVYLEEELERAAQTLKGAPLLLNHTHPLNGRVIEAKYEDGAVRYVAELRDERVLEWIRNGTIRHCSVEYEWDSLERVDGIAPRGIRFTGLALLKDFEPGDPKSSVEVWEGIIAKLREAKKARDEGRRLLERVWTRRYIDNLPDEAFAIILPGGEKDETGRTTPRSLRKFPHHTMDGAIDLPHLRNANARLPQSNLTPAQKARAAEHLNAHKRALGIAEGGEEEAIRRWLEEAGEAQDDVGYVPEADGDFRVTPEPTLDEVIASVEGAIGEVEDLIDGVNVALRTLYDRVDALESVVYKGPPKPEGEVEDKTRGEAVINPEPDAEPSSEYIRKDEVIRELRRAVFERVPRHWGYGPYEQNRRIKALIKRLEASKG